MNPVVNALKEKTEDIHILSSGVRVILGDVSQMEVQTIAAQVEAPAIPLFIDPDTGRDIPNEADPLYVAAVTRTNMRRGMLVLESALLSVKLVDGLPLDTTWIEELRFKEKRGIASLEGLDLDSSYEREFAYKKFVAFRSNTDWELLQVKVQEVTRAARVAESSFRSDEERSADSGPFTEEGNNGNRPEYPVQQPVLDSGSPGSSG